MRRRRCPLTDVKRTAHYNTTSIKSEAFHSERTENRIETNLHNRILVTQLIIMLQLREERLKIISYNSGLGIRNLNGISEYAHTLSSSMDAISKSVLFSMKNEPWNKTGRMPEGRKNGCYT